jgi:hypothetical protein
MASQTYYLGLFAQPQPPAGLFAPPVQAGGMFAAPQASMRPYQPTIREQLGNAVYDFMMARGLPSAADQYRGVAQGAADFVPGLNDAVAAEEGGRALNAGDYLGAGLAAGSIVVPVAGDVARKGIRAYHGSPHDFDRFSMEHIGKGEGAQTYGHGLYFAEEEAVAKDYRKKLGLNKASMGADEEAFIARLFRTADGDKKAVLARLDAQGEKLGGTPEYRARLRKMAEEFEPPGKMYEVSINADPDEFLDWDKPLFQQSPEVRKKLEKVFGPIPEDGILSTPWNNTVPAALKNPDVMDSAYYRTPSREYKSKGKRAEDVLKDAGIKGIRYLDQGSRGAGDGTRNFVVFDDATIEIMRKYGILAPLAGTAAAGSMTDDSGT